ncbi:MAG: hypothetical protein Q8L86_11175 [Vicinamibacterales bacterium]|nr:hypothetical protein [Vicinamibacterales bacterium]
MLDGPNLFVRGTIWAALVLFVAGEAGRRRGRTAPAPWALPAFVAGALLCALHFAAVFHWHHGWSHADAAIATARQMAEVFGTGWGGSIWFNYLFLAVWIADAAGWARDPHAAVRPPSRGVWLRRAFYAVMIVNATVVFVPWPMQWLGVAICAALAWVWGTVGSG